MSIAKPTSLDMMLDLEVPDDEELEAPPVLRVRSKSTVSPAAAPDGFSVNCLVTPKKACKRRSFSIVFERRCRLDAKLQQRTRTVLSIDFTLLRLLLLLACLSTARALVVPAATRPAFEPRRLALETGRSQLRLAEVALTSPRPAPIQSAAAALRQGLSDARREVGRQVTAGRLEVARAVLSQQYQTEHVLMEHPHSARAAAFAAPLAALSEGVCKTLYPGSHHAVSAWHSSNRGAAELELAHTERRLSQALALELPAHAVAVKSRVKSPLSIFDKAVLRGKGVSDLLGIRLVVDAEGAEGEAQCYEAARVVDRLWPGGTLKDYVASPKANGYQSLHMLVTTRDGVEIEVQIRTGAMHEAAERGAAAHALYKAAATGGASERVESVVFA